MDTDSLRLGKKACALYFAYGSNLDGDQMQQRCPAARPVGRAVLSNHALTFGGYSRRWDGAVASVRRARGVRVEGFLYQLEGADWRALDRYEGHPWAYQRAVRFAVDDTSRKRRVVLYTRPEERLKPGPPSWDYFDVMRREYARLGFDSKALATAAGVEP